MNISIQTIPHKTQRYPTVGDYFIDDEDNLQILVSDMGNVDFEFLVAVHELVEAYLCLKRGIDYDRITEFDKRFEQMRKQFPDIVKGREPGDDEEAPYASEHSIASNIERQLAEEMQIDWHEYDKKVNEL